MKGSSNSRRDLGKGGGLRFRCARCRTLRKEDTIDGNHGHEDHASPSSRTVKGEGLVCGWCVLREKGIETFTERRDYEVVTRDVKSGRVLKRVKDPKPKCDHVVARSTSE